MSDLTELQSAGNTKVVGSSPSGVESNYLAVDANQSAQVTVKDSSGNSLTSTLVSSKQALDVNVVADSGISDRSGTGNISSLNGTVVAPSTGASTVYFNITGTWSGILTPEGQDGNGNWQPTIALLVGSGTTVGSLNGNFPITVSAGGFNQVRLRMSSYTSGTAIVNYNVGSGINAVQVYNTTATSLQATIAPLTTTTLINSNSIPVDGTKASYSASVANLATGLLATDIFTIAGSASKVVRITRIEVSGTTSAGGAATFTLQLIRRSSANTGGTSSAATAVSYDTTNSSATASVLSYTANPTGLGTTVGTVRATRVGITPATGGSAADPIVYSYDFGNRPTQAIVLRGTSQLLALNIGGTTLTGPVLSINIEWTEE